MRTIPLSVIALAVTLAAPAAEAQDYSGRVTLTDDAAVGGFVAFNIWVDDYTTDTARQRYIETLAGDGAAKLESDLLNERVGVASKLCELVLGGLFQRRDASVRCQSWCSDYSFCYPDRRTR